MRRCSKLTLLLLIVATGTLCSAGAPNNDKLHDGSPPFGLGNLQPLTLQGKDVAQSDAVIYKPRNAYNIFINYELGMHCVGFDISYCCIIPPYNSVQAQAVQSASSENDPPVLLSPDNKVRLTYSIRDNTYSEGNKMKYWQVPKDVTGAGTMANPGDNMPNYVWSHLFIYKGLEGTLPDRPEKAARRHIGKEIPVNIDSGPSGKTLSGENMDYAKERGGNIVYTDSMLPELPDIPIVLTSSYIWDALGLPLTAFNDSRRRGSIRTITDLDFQPFQYALVRLTDDKAHPILQDGKPVEFFGTEPVDIAICSTCHSGHGVAANFSRGAGLTLFDKEYLYWKTKYPDTSEYIARQSSASILVLELHDMRHKTSFLKAYDAQAPSNRLGKVGPVHCADCHGDNMSGTLQSPRPGVTGYQGLRAKPLTEAIHLVHARFIRMPDKAGRTQSCQACHPSHWQNQKMNNFQTNRYQITDDMGNPRFSGTDLRVSGGGCYLRRDAHANPHVKPPFFLNEIGKWYLREVSMRDESGSKIEEIRGLYCTNCHNNLTHELYRYDDLRNAAAQEGKTLRNKPIGDVIKAVAGGDEKKFKTFLADPVVGAPGEPLYSYFADHKTAPLARAVRSSGGKIKFLAWNADKGDEISYSAVSAGKDWWLSPGEPHCADCHIAPFVESEGGKYFPIDQPGKYSLYRYSKAHGALACQTCHQSMHGLYPVRYDGLVETVDVASHEQALQFSPDGSYVGPVTCAACHTVNTKGVPTVLKGTGYYSDYWASVVLVHFTREKDRNLPVKELVEKYPYAKAKEIITAGWK